MDELEIKAQRIDVKEPRGGNIKFKAGRGAADRNGKEWPDGAFIFELADGKEMIRIEPTGEVFVRGTKVDDDRKVYESFREWFLHAEIKLVPGGQ